MKTEQTLESALELKRRLEAIKHKPASFGCKKLILESIKVSLQQLANKKKNLVPDHNIDFSKLDGTTFFTEAKSVLRGDDGEQEELIQRILQKQKLKIQMDQEIETSEDDLLQMEKVVQTKQLYSEELTTKIARKTRQLETQTNKKNQLQKVKSSPSLLKIIFG